MESGRVVGSLEGLLAHTEAASGDFVCAQTLKGRRRLHRPPVHKTVAWFLSVITDDIKKRCRCTEGRRNLLCIVIPLSELELDRVMDLVNRILSESVNVDVELFEGDELNVLDWEAEKTSYF
eukprot:gene10577-3231_t